MSGRGKLLTGPRGFGSAPLGNMFRNIPAQEAAAALDAACHQGNHFPRPPPKAQPPRTVPHQAMTPQVAEPTVTPWARYAAGTREVRESCFSGRPIHDEYRIVEGRNLAGTGARSQRVGGAQKATAASRKANVAKAQNT
jgi:hypothetical protein